MNSKTLIGIATFGNVNFTRLAIQGIKETVKNPYDIFIVIGKPGDTETEDLCNEFNITYVTHDENWGFPVAVNDLYTYAWELNDYEYLVIIGNDVIPYPYAIDSLINEANSSDHEWICSTQYDVRNLCAEFPDAKQYFEGEKYLFNFMGEPWRLYTRYSEEPKMIEIGLSDVQNLCLYKKSVFDKIGFTDVNFYPAYYIDNDYARRGVNANVKGCTMANSVYFHFWSRTIHQGSGGSTPTFFEKNRAYYIRKWGGDFGKEMWRIPFGGVDFPTSYGVILPGNLKISSRKDERDIVRYWMGK